MTSLTCFKAYDIRGLLGDELNDDIAYRIGRAYASVINPGTVVVGGDVRLSSESLKLALTEGLLESGVDVIDLGMTGTEEIYFATWHLKADGGIEVTASHNPMDYNGMKLVREDAKPISGDSGLKQIRELAEKDVFPAIAKRGELIRTSITEAYADHLLSYIQIDQLKPMRIVVNSGNGAAGHIVDAIERAFRQSGVPIDLIKIHHEPDGSFPNGIPNPLLPERRQATTDAVLTHQADLGIAWDGDFDRCFMFDEQGKFIEGYYIVSLLAESILKNHPGAKIIHDPRLTWNTIQQVEQAGGIPIQSKTGHAFIKERMRQEDAVYGGEMSAHHYFRDFKYCDSGMIPWLLVTELLSRRKLPLSMLVKKMIETYPSSGEINMRVANPSARISSVRSNYEFASNAIDLTDGLSLEFDTWRFNLRSSNTEPVLRLNVETKGDPDLLETKTNELVELIQTV